MVASGTRERIGLKPPVRMRLAVLFVSVGARSGRPPVCAGSSRLLCLCPEAQGPRIPGPYEGQRSEGAEEPQGGRCGLGRQDCTLACRSRLCSVCGPKEGFTFYDHSLDKSDLGQSKHSRRKNKGN